MCTKLYTAFDENNALVCACRDPWVLPSDSHGKRRLKQIKTDYSGAVGGLSDHLILVRLFNDWSLLATRAQQHRFAAENFLSLSTLLMIKGMREQLVKDLSARGLLQVSPTGTFHQSKRAQNQTIVRCVLVCLFRTSVSRGGGGSKRLSATLAACHVGKGKWF
jgi:hypothetical protein